MMQARTMLAALACTWALASPALAQDAFPSKAIHVVNPYAAGGVVDVLARALGARLSQTLGVPFVHEAKPGGGGNIGTDYAAQSSADGYTWLIATTSNAANMSLMPNIRTDLEKDFVPVAQFAISPNYFVVPKNLPVENVKEYVELAKSNPGKLNYGSAGIGSTPHLGFELFKHVANIDVVAVPYKGAPPIVSDLIAGHVSATYMPSSLAIAQGKSGRLKVLAVVGEKRTKDFPNVPTLGESGYPKAVVAPWFAVLVPAGTPAETVKKIESAIQEALREPEVIARFESAGAIPSFRNREETARMIKAEIISWRSLVKSANLRAE